MVPPLPHLLAEGQQGRASEGDNRTDRICAPLIKPCILLREIESEAVAPPTPGKPGHRFAVQSR